MLTDWDTKIARFLNLCVNARRAARVVIRFRAEALSRRSLKTIFIGDRHIIYAVDSRLRTTLQPAQRVASHGLKLWDISVEREALEVECDSGAHSDQGAESLV